MPVPKRKVSKARRDQRQSTKFIRPQAFTFCSNCELPLNTHAACLECGYYKGRKIMAGKLDKKIRKAQKMQAHHAAQVSKEQVAKTEAPDVQQSE